MKRSLLTETLQRKKAIRVPKGRQRAKAACTLPMRTTSCIFKKPLTKITSHHSNQVRYKREEMQGKLEKPKQLSGLMRLQGLHVYDSEGQLLPSFDPVNPSLIISWGRQVDKSRGQAGADNRPVHLQPSSNQPPYQRVTAPAGDPHWPPLFQQQVTVADIRRQTRKVKQARKKLAEALKADSLAREAERAREEEELR
ncbi:putative methyl-CpG-binding domain protein 3-like 5 [Perognathus longimembris pacificus]|uniref:putative methyl-CpG-binding domain protein 3-like 5 n=1 Tax=Perognathus longimembris pacificus TaxID=214514 RepID=UPI00201918A0|nr:putative methyl-CpG-binding domain protein 3-like 5 [Perognathus longimembris pacificus]